jgi:tetratricopeptide (TPR) repeat protein
MFFEILHRSGLELFHIPIIDSSPPCYFKCNNKCSRLRFRTDIDFSESIIRRIDPMTTEVQSEPGKNDPSDFEQRIAEYAKAVNEGRSQEAEGMLMEMLMAAGAAAIADPTPDLIWKNIANECEELGNWAAAEDAHQKSLALAKEHANPVLALKPHLDLAGFYEMLGRKEEALPYIEIALELARKSEIESLVRMALDAKISPDLAPESLEEIRTEAEAALKRLPLEPIYHTTKAFFLLIQARCMVELRNYEAAEKYLSDTSEFIGETNQSGFLVGYQGFHGRVAAVMAKIHAGRGETEQAITAFSETVARQRTIAEQPQVAGVRTRYRTACALRIFAGYLEKGGRMAEAEQARTEAKQILEELKLPVGPD